MKIKINIKLDSEEEIPNFVSLLTRPDNILFSINDFKKELYLNSQEVSQKFDSKLCEIFLDLESKSSAA